MDRVMVDPVSSTPASLLRRLVIAGWGVCCGTFLATAITTVLIAGHGKSPQSLHPSLLPSEYLTRFGEVYWQERYERIWFALVCMLGSLGGLVAARFVRPSARLALPAIIAFIPAAAWVCRGVFKGETNLDRFLAIAAILSLPLFRRAPRPAPTDEPLSPVVDATPPSSRRMWIAAGIVSFPLTLLLYGVVGPHHLATVAGECNNELHVASYIVGPALYYRAPGVVPGLDFESHYGVGHAYVFSFVMGSGGLEKTLERFVLFVLVACILFYLSAFWVLTDWLRSVPGALAITLLTLFVTCEGLGYNYPSCCPVRYPFLFAFLFTAVRGVGPNGTRSCVASGAVAALSLFWQTDVGLYTLAAGFAFYLVGALFLREGVWRPLVFIASGLGSFAALCFLCFGPRVLSITFAERLLEPLLLYATGFGSQLMYWKPGWSYWYNLLGPGLAVASVAVMMAGGRKGLPPRAVLYGAAASLLGLAMLFKWVNRSIDILWNLNGALVAAVAGWWIWVGWRAIADRVARESRPWQGFIRQAAAATILIGLAYQAIRLDWDHANRNHQGGSSSPVVRAVNRLQHFRNPINAVRKGIEPTIHSSPIDAASSRYLRAHTRRKERVAVISDADWNYLADAGRAPRLSWLQLFLVHSPVLLDRCANDLRNSDRIFVDRNSLGTLKHLNSAAHEVVMQILTERFDVADESPTRWRLYRRKPGLVAGR